MTEEGHQGKLCRDYRPRLLSFKDAVAEIANATGRKIDFEKVPIKAYASVLKEFQLPEQVIWLITYLFTEVLDGRNAVLTGGVHAGAGKATHRFFGICKKGGAYWRMECTVSNSTITQYNKQNEKTSSIYAHLTRWVCCRPGR